MTFHGWLMEQRDRRDWVGDLARDARADDEWPARNRSNAGFRHYLEDCGAVENALVAFDQAWAEWELVR